MSAVPIDKKPIDNETIEQQNKTKESVDVPDDSKPNTSSWFEKLREGLGNFGNTLKGKSPAPAAAEAAAGGTKGGKRKTKKGKKAKKTKKRKSKRSRK
jgi:hypothetical protein